MGIALIVIGLLFLGGGSASLVLGCRSFGKDRSKNVFSKKEIYLFACGLMANAIGGGFFFGSISPLNDFPMSSGHLVMLIVGGILFALFFSILWSCFYIRFYRKDAEVSLLKWIKIGLYSSIALSIIFFLLLMEGLAPYLTYPLVSGFVIGNEGFKWVRAGQNPGKGFHVAWYGVIIVFSAIVAYWISDHRFYQKYHKHGMLDSLLLVAFPAGLLGARIWYVVGNWNGDAANGVAFSKLMGTDQWWRIFAVWEGGLTILGGAVGGIIAGVIFMRIRRKYVDVRWAMDMIVPTILIAQAIGRWGNFFNVEVYGGETPISSWNFLPTFIQMQMSYNGNGSLLGNGTMHVPLFLIESIANIIGYYVIAYLIPFIWKKYRPTGSLCGCYLIWYGIVRIIMEPLRDVNYNMGSNGSWSVWNSLVYIILGIALIGLFFLLDYLKSKKPMPIASQDKEKISSIEDHKEE
ncbi:MAG TPA: prolipoprotein diacylglyceryl transferase [Firmicutes bacterium]|mgnify:FL=1|nr:prolipoprotein diacylglyceryl transferase [Bacillota bacterium]HBM70385.1 prolipoprotein diacylglyceryl transferase [Bacillota bacterium]HBX25448.1 prolipoprotein diacylglyceryl transferase [Bacillota bacterium]